MDAIPSRSSLSPPVRHQYSAFRHVPWQAAFRSPYISSPSVGAPGDKPTALSHDRNPARRTSLLPVSTGGLLMDGDYTHVPVMLDEVLNAISSTPELPVIDATLGGAGHAAAILRRFKGRALIGLDQDLTAVEVATARLATFNGRARIHHARFDEISHVAMAEGVAAGGASAVLFDLGVSSYQLDTASRGFSYHQEGPLDMRMNTEHGQTASEYLEHSTEAELTALFYLHGETRFARKIARAIVAARPIRTTTELADLVERTIPAAARRRGHPARRVFQALRVAVNAELDVLGSALDDAIALLAPKGRIIVLSYHSGEDRIAKEHLLYGATGGCVCPPGLPCVCGAQPTLRLLNRGARMASEEEIARNARARSVRLRIAERLEPAEGDGGTSWR